MSAPKGLRALGDLLRTLDSQLRTDICTRCGRPRSGFVPYAGSLVRRRDAYGGESLEPRNVPSPKEVRRAGGLCECPPESP